MKKYHTGEVIIAVFILFVLWGGWKLSAEVVGAPEIFPVPQNTT